jgi:hypothetical protein
LCVAYRNQAGMTETKIARDRATRSHQIVRDGIL